MLAERVRLLNFVANQPEVRRELAPGHHSIDLEYLLDDPKSCMFGNEHGLVLFIHIGDGLFEGHYLLTDTADRRASVAMIRRAITALFTKGGASAITGVTPCANLGARAMNRALGFVPVGTATDAAKRSCIRYRLEKSSWVPS
jgi:RimJ/RimL family protein N-acetyltransferase